MDDINLSTRLQNVLLQRGKNMRNASLFVKVALLGLGSTLVSIAQFAQFPPQGPSAWQVAGILASVIVAVGSIFVVFTDSDASESLSLAAAALEEIKELEKNLEFLVDLDSDNIRLIELFQSMNLMRAVIERFSKIPDKSDEQIAVALLKAANRNLCIAMNFQQHEQWTVAIYKAFPDSENPGKIVLKNVAHWRAIECDISESRVWKEGTGIMGVAYSNKDEIIIPDLQSDGAKAIFGTAANQQRDYDRNRYRSMAAVPVNVVGAQLPWGVVTATTDRVSHFSPDGELGARPDEAVRALAGMMALGVALCQSS